MKKEEKDELRQQMRLRAQQLDIEQKKYLSSRVMKELEELPIFANAKIIALYWSIGSEVITHDLITRWGNRKHIVLPVVVGGDMKFKRFSTIETLTKGEFSISEPSCGEQIDPAHIDLVVVPGVAFGRCGERLGRGKGFYDKFLCACSAYKIGVCFDHQIAEQVACDPHDVMMDMILTPSEKIIVK